VIIGLRRIELHDLADLIRASRAPLILRADVQHALVVDHDRRVGVVTGPEPEHPLVVRAALEDVADVRHLCVLDGPVPCGID